MTKIPSVEERMAEFTLFGVHSYIERTDDTELLPINEFFCGVVENEKGKTVVLSDWLRKTLTAEREAGARERDIYWLKYIEARATLMLEGSVIAISDQLLADINVASSKLEALTPPTK